MSERALKLYEEELGREALERQRDLAKALWPCCGEHRGGPHHEMCKKYEAPVAVVHTDQIGLL